MSTVFFTHHPGRFEQRQQCWVPLDLTPAEAFGTVRVVLPPDRRPPPPAQALSLLRPALHEFTSRDYIAMAGDTELLICAVLLAVRRLGGKMPALLKWDGRERAYHEVTIPENVLFE